MTSSRSLRSLRALRTKLAAEVRAELAAMPNRCIECLCPLPHGNRCENCKGTWPFAIPLPIHFAGNPHPSEIVSDTQYHGENYES